MLIKSQCHSLYPVYCTESLSPVQNMAEWRRGSGEQESKINYTNVAEPLKNNGPIYLNRPWMQARSQDSLYKKSLLVSARSLCIKSPAYSQSIEARIAKIQKLLTTADSTFYHEKDQTCARQKPRMNMYHHSASAIINIRLHMSTYTLIHLPHTYILLV